MPLYSYICESCGEFEDWQSMALSCEPAVCGQCGSLARRGVAAPRLVTMASNTRIAHDRNEKAAHEPPVVRKENHKHDGDSHPHRHGGHGCSHGHSHSHGHGRPWMIGH